MYGYGVCNVIPFLSTPSVRRATGYSQGNPDDFSISIHALREEGDCLSSVGGRNMAIFLSTPSVRRATQQVIQLGAHGRNFYPRPP